MIIILFFCRRLYVNHAEVTCTGSWRNIFDRSSLTTVCILYKNPGFWLVNSRCIFRVFSYLGLISFIFTGYLHEDLTFLPSRASNRQIHSEYFFFIFIRKVMWLFKFETRKCSVVKDLSFFPLAWYLRKCISLFYPHVPQTAKFIRNTSTTV
jgi:hypothetical protein